MKFLKIVLLCVVSLALWGCESGDSSSGGNSASLVGTWSLRNGGSTWYIHFGSDNNWKITDDAAGQARRVFGTYSVSGNSFSGPMQNPGTGKGEIRGTVDGSSMTLDFIEHWHTPYKHVPYVGTKIR